MICKECSLPIPTLAAHVKLAGGSANYFHFFCFMDKEIAKAKEQARQALLDEQVAERVKLIAEKETAALAQELQAAAKAKAEAEIKAAAATALANERAKAAQFMPKAAATQGVSEAGERRLDLDDDDIAKAAKAKAEEDARKAAELAEVKAREEAAKAAQPKCVRCGAPAGSTYHPNHCSRCWNDDSTGQGPGGAKGDKFDGDKFAKDLDKAVNAGIRPLELD